MKALYDCENDEFNVEISKQDLKEAFKTRKSYISFLRQIITITYGPEMADQCFPIEEYEEEEDGNDNSDMVNSDM